MTHTTSREPCTNCGAAGFAPIDELDDDERFVLERKCTADRLEEMKKQKLRVCMRCFHVEKIPRSTIA